MESATLSNGSTKRNQSTVGHVKAARVGLGIFCVPLASPLRIFAYIGSVAAWQRREHRRSFCIAAFDPERIAERSRGLSVASQRCDTPGQILIEVIDPGRIAEAQSGHQRITSVFRHSEECMSQAYHARRNRPR